MNENNKSFLVKENIFGTRKLYSNDSSLGSLIFSELSSKVVCASNYVRSMNTSWSDYFTKDNKVLRGYINLEYEINNPINYSYELLTDEVIDVITRTVLSSYFKHLDLSKIKDETINIDKDNEKLVMVINYYLKRYLPYIKITNISNIRISRDFDTNVDEPFVIIDEKKYNVEEDSNIKTFSTVTKSIEDDVVTKENVKRPKQTYVAKNERLYYCGHIRKPGLYRGRKALGNIIASGKHVFSATPCIYEEENVKYKIYPNFLYDVKDITLYLYNYNEIRNLFNCLSSLIIMYGYKESDYIVDLNEIYDRGNEDIKEIILDIEKYGVILEYVSYTMKNPYTFEKTRKKDEKGYEYISLK